MANIILESLVSGDIVRNSGLVVELCRGTSVLANTQTPETPISMRQSLPGCRLIDHRGLVDPKVAYATKGASPEAGRSRRQVSFLNRRERVFASHRLAAILSGSKATRTPPVSTRGTRAYSW
jgi:hypothetical protein